MANFNVDTSGNLWIGTGVSDSFSTAQSEANTKFYVTSAGAIYAVSGHIGGIVIDANGMESSNYDASTDTGWRFDNDTATVFAYKIDLKIEGGAADPPTVDTQKLDIGSARIYEFNSDLILDASGTGNDVVVKTGDRFRLSGVGSDPTMLFDGAQGNVELDLDQVTDGTTSSGRSYTSETLGYVNELTFKNQDVDIFRINAQNSDVYFYGQVEIAGDFIPNNLKAYNGFGSSGQTLQRTSNGIEWVSSSGSHSDSDHTSFSASGHDHDSDYDNFDHIDINGLQMDSGFGLTITGGTGISVSESSSPHTITITNTASSGGVTSLGDTNNSPNLTGDVDLVVTSDDGYFLSSISGNSSDNKITFNKTSYGYVNTLDPTATSPKVGISTSDRFSNIYSQSFYGTFYGLNVNASSRNIKENIEDTALGLDFINDLPVKDFTMIDTDNYGTQKYIGFIAEDLQDYLAENSLDYKLVEDYSSVYEYKDRCSHVMKCTNEESDMLQGCTNECCSDYFPREDEDGVTKNYLHETVEDCEAYKPDENRHPHLYFNNFIGPLVKAVQELSTQISDLTARIEVLEG